MAWKVRFLTVKRMPRTNKKGTNKNYFLVIHYLRVKKSRYKWGQEGYVAVIAYRF